MRAAAEQHQTVEAARQADRDAARAIRTFQADGNHEAAAERYSEIVERHQRRASRIAFHYLRDAADADDAVQEAFIKTFTHLDTYRDELPFEVWFTRVLINGCLDRIKSRNRRSRWIVPIEDQGRGGAMEAVIDDPSPEARTLAAERRRQISAALARLPERQRAVFVLSQEHGYSSREVSAMIGMKESTVRVHLFRAIRKLRTLLER
jgi:RNA polymerase sigma-70 factor (ECF subfamily)